MDIIQIIVDDNAVLCNETEKQSRIAMCTGCDQLKNNVCNACNCLVDVRASYKLADCPLGKWDGNTL